MHPCGVVVMNVFDLALIVLFRYNALDVLSIKIGGTVIGLFSSLIHITIRLRNLSPSFQRILKERVGLCVSAS
jgi:hypothetical protein